MAIVPLILFVVAGSGTPGPNNTIVMASGASFGFRRTLPAIIGVNTGFPVMTILVGLGLGQVIEQWPFILDIIRPIGVLYLLYLAWKIANGPTDVTARSAGKPPGFWQLAGFQFVNPKAWAMSVGAIAAFTGFWDSFLLEVLVIALAFLVFSTPNTAIWTLIGVGAGRIISKARHMRILNIVMAGLLVASLIPAVIDAVESIS